MEDNSNLQNLINLAGSSDVSSGMLSWLACSDEPLILSSVASNPNASLNLLCHLLVTCHDSTIQSEIMGNPTYVAYQRGLVLADLEMEEGLLSSEMLDEIWRG